MNDANRAIGLAPNYSFVYRGRANVYNDMGEYLPAINDYTQAIKISPDDGGLFIDRGKIYVRMAKSQDAISDFSHALDLDKKWTAAFRERGLTYKLMGQFDAARNDLIAFSQIEPSDSVVSQALVELQSVTTAPKVTTESPMIPPSVSSGVDLRSAVIPMQGEAGTFVVPVLINGVVFLNFTVDSGATDVSIPADVVMTLIRSHTLNMDTDFLGTQTYVLADGSKIPSQNFRIRSLKVGDKVLENVTGSVAPVAGNLLLGQSFLSRFTSWSIDNRRKVLILQ